MRIDSRYQVHRLRVPEFDEVAIKSEPMLFNCDLGHAVSLGGLITRAALALLPPAWLDAPLVVDSRVHMLMPGWFPCIPGWHHDDVPRTRSDGQPNYAEGQLRSEHAFLLVNGGVCPTALAQGSADFEEPALGRVIYGDWHAAVEAKIRAGELELSHAPSNHWVFMSDRTWHTGTAARLNGWRFFIRASRYFAEDGRPVARGNPRTNEVRRQVQVYLSNPNAGW